MSGGDDANLRIILEQLAKLTGQPAPPPITPDQLAMGRSPFSQLLKVLGIAANSGDPRDNLEAETGYAERSAKTADALAKFPANEEESAAQLAGVGSQSPMGQMVQQIPQIVSGIAGGIAGAIGGVLQPLSQIPQQAAQAGQQALQAGMGALQHSGGAELAEEATPGEFVGAGGGGSGLGGGGGSGEGGFGTTTPTAMLGPLPAPSAGTVPAASHAAALPQSSPAESAGAPRGAMGAMPMMPPGAMQGAAGAAGDAKPDTKRIVGPTVKNGAPVQGRITTPPPTPEVIRRVEGKPIATRRILLPEHKRDEGDDDSGR